MTSQRLSRTAINAIGRIAYCLELYSLILAVVIYIALTLFKRQLKTVPFHHQTFCELSITI